MLNSLNSQTIYNSNIFNNNKFLQNNNKILETDENAICEPTIGTRYAVTDPIDQYLNTLFPSIPGQIGMGLQTFKTEDTRMTSTDCEDSGFVTSNSSLSSPQLSPVSGSSSHYNPIDTSTSHPFEDYTQLSFQGITSASNWNLANLDQNQPSSLSAPGLATKEIKLFSNYPSKSVIHNCELRIMKQPETHHRARYMTEGSRGTIKDRTGRGYPVVQLYGFSKSTVKLQCFIGDDQKMGEPHLFYQACEVSGKTAYTFSKVDGINVIELDLLPKHNMQTVLDCMGILKERNVDVERKVLRNRRRCHRPSTVATGATEEVKLVRNTNKCRSTHCRMVFRCILPETGEVLQVVTDPILCTQPLGSPEIYKMSLRESDLKGGQELFIIGKNFHKDSKVIFSVGHHWRNVQNPVKEFLNSTHLVCQVPPYNGLDAKYQSNINADISIDCNHKTSDSMKFLYTNCSSLQNQNSSENLNNCDSTLISQQLSTQTTLNSSDSLNSKINWYNKSE